MARVLRVVLAGFGRVGRRFARLLYEYRGWFEERFGLRPVLVAVADSRGYVAVRGGMEWSLVERLLGLPRGGLAGAGSPGSVLDVLDGLDYDVFVDVVASRYSDGWPGLVFAERVVGSGRPFVTADKPPVALALHRLGWRLVFYKATVMAGTPLIDMLRFGFMGRRVGRVVGVLNGTSNYVLGLVEKGYGLREAVGRAQEEGYAEPDPSADLEGADLACKAAIIAQTLGCRTTLRDVVVEGRVDEDAARRARGLVAAGRRLKYVAVVDAVSCRARVVLAEVDRGDPLYRVEGARNGVVVEAADGARVFLEGPGAGLDVTAWTLLSDMVLASRLVYGYV